MNVGYVQNSPVFGDKEQNFNQVRILTRNIKADLLVLPETVPHLGTVEIGC